MTLLKQLKQKYSRLYARVAKALQTGKFATYTAAQQQAIYNRLRRYENRLKQLGVVVISAAALFFLPMQAAGQVVPVGTEFLVNTYTVDHQANSSIAMDSDGDFVITWQSMGQDGSDYGVYAQRYNSSGAIQGGEFLVNTHTVSSQYNPSIAMDSDGDFVIAWQSYGQDGSSYGVYAQRYNSSGAAQGGEFQVNTHTANGQLYPSIAMDSDGDFVIAWMSLGQDGSSWGVYAQRYNSNGAAQSSEFLVNTHTADYQTHPSIAMDSDGDFVIAWSSFGQDGNGWGVYAQRYNSSGAAEGSEFLVNTHTVNSQFNPSIAMDSDGYFVIAWDSFRQDGNYHDIYAQRYNSSGAVQGGEFLVNTHTASTQSNPSIAMDSDGDFVIAWNSIWQDGSAYGVYAQRYNSSGAAQGGEFLVNTYVTSIQRYPSIAMDSDGDFVIAWQSYWQDESGNGVYAQRYALGVATTSDLTAATKILLYPNPVSEVVVIENAVGTATVFNALGQALQEFIITDDKHFFNTNGLTRGVYTLQVRDVNGTVAVKQFIK
jgi:hypothetical protein